MTATTIPTSLLHIFFALICILPNTLYSNEIENENGNVKGMFVFGSSLVDNGNNNNLRNLAKADYLPYGIDFPLGSSGRFTNGKNVIDLLGEKLGFPSFLPIFTDPSTKGNRTLGGVNYASGGSGILDDTGSIIGDVMTLNEQIKNFEEVTLPDLNVQLEGNSAESIPKYLFVVGSGGNDYTLNFFLTNQAANISVEEFTANLTTTLCGQLKKLYDLGARKFIVMSLYPLGCGPSAIAANPQQNGCTRFLNRAARLFNSNLRSLIFEIRPRMPASNIVVVDSYTIVRDIIQGSPSNGFSNTTNACCEVGGNGISCKRGGSVCGNRSDYVYFDGLHPTEAVNVVLATKAFASNSRDEVYPINVRQLARI